MVEDWRLKKVESLRISARDWRLKIEGVSEKNEGESEVKNLST